MRLARRPVAILRSASGVWAARARPRLRWRPARRCRSMSAALAATPAAPCRMGAPMAAVPVVPVVSYRRQQWGGWRWSVRRAHWIVRARRACRGWRRRRGRRYLRRRCRRRYDRWHPDQRIRPAAHGTGGTQSAGGTGGSLSGSPNGANGASGTGGAGGDQPANVGGSGGGGGYFGGGGGAASAGGARGSGGGGSGFGTTVVSGVRSGNGLVRITYAGGQLRVVKSLSPVRLIRGSSICRSTAPPRRPMSAMAGIRVSRRSSRARVRSGRRLGRRRPWGITRARSCARTTTGRAPRWRPVRVRGRSTFP